MYEPGNMSLDVMLLITKIYCFHWTRIFSRYVLYFSVFIAPYLSEGHQKLFREKKMNSIYLFLIYLLIMLLRLSHFCPFTQLHPAYPLPPTFPADSSCPWVILISSLASTFPTLFLPYLFSTYRLCYLFSVPFPPSPPPSPLLITLHVISISMVLFLFQLFAQFAFVFVLGVVVNNCEFAVIFTVPIFDLLFLR